MIWDWKNQYGNRILEQLGGDRGKLRLGADAVYAR